MAEILKSLISSIKNDAKVKSIYIGANLLLVASNKNTGLASTIPSQLPHGEDLVKNAGNLAKTSALELAKLSLSKNTLESGIGIAALNSLLSEEFPHTKKKNIIDYFMAKGIGKEIAFIGHFPFIKKLKDFARKIWVIELKPTEEEFSPDQAQEIIPNVDILAMTANTLITHATESYLQYCKPETKKVLMGPTTPLSTIMFDYGFDVLAGVKVKEPETVLRYISQGAAFSQVKGVEKVTIEK